MISSYRNKFQRRGALSALLVITLLSTTAFGWQGTLSEAERKATDRVKLESIREITTRLPSIGSSNRLGHSRKLPQTLTTTELVPRRMVQLNAWSALGQSIPNSGRHLQKLPQRLALKWRQIRCRKRTRLSVQIITRL